MSKQYYPMYSPETKKFYIAFEWDEDIDGRTGYPLARRQEFTSATEVIGFVDQRFDNLPFDVQVAYTQFKHIFQGTYDGILD